MQLLLVRLSVYGGQRETAGRSMRYSDGPLPSPLFQPNWMNSLTSPSVQETTDCRYGYSTVKASDWEPLILVLRAARGAFDLRSSGVCVRFPFLRLANFSRSYQPINFEPISRADRVINTDQNASYLLGGPTSSTSFGELSRYLVVESWHTRDASRTPYERRLSLFMVRNSMGNPQRLPVRQPCDFFRFSYELIRGTGTPCKWPAAAMFPIPIPIEVQSAKILLFCSPLLLTWTVKQTMLSVWSIQFDHLVVSMTLRNNVCQCLFKALLVTFVCLIRANR